MVSASRSRRSGTPPRSTLTGLGIWLLVAAGSSAAPAQAADPFVPAGHERIQLAVTEDSVVRSLQAAGFVVEERTRISVILLADAEDKARLDALGHPWSPLVDESDERAFTTYTAMTTELAQLASTYSSIARLESAGTSVQGRELWALCVTANPGVEEAEPEVRIVGAHHGNEKMATEICMNLAHLLLEGYGVDPRLTQYVDSREIWIVPMVNPDGHTANSRYNARGVDLNRNYGYMWEGGGSAAFSEPETRAMRDLATDHWFSLSLSFHTSGDIVNSVWNYTPDYTEDDAVVWRLTEDYADYNGYWAVRGWYWYETHGDCNDWSYGARGDIDWTIETSNSDEATVWEKNREAILDIIEAAGWGIHGTVTDAITGEPLRARVYVEGNDWPAFTDPLAGDFHKPLLSGVYDIRICANAHEDAVLESVVVPLSGAVTVSVALAPSPGHFADVVEQANCPDPSNLYQNATLSMFALGAPDGAGYSIGRGGDVVLDFGPGSLVRDVAGPDLTVFESAEDALVERCNVWAGNDPFGPWTLVGAATGTTSLDLAATGLVEARYLRIVDDGDGSASGAYPGFELDAIESIGASLSSAPDLAGGGSWTETIGAVYPNPVRSGAAFRLTGLEEGRSAWMASPSGPSTAVFELIDATGRQVRRLDALSRGISGETSSWRASEASGRPLAPGVYLVRVSSGEASLARKLVVLP